MRVLALCVVSTFLACSPISTQQPCGPTTCTGCCDDKGSCQGGGVNAACGAGGFICDQCGSDEMCSLGRCSPVTFGGGGGTGGGTGGGSGGGGGGTSDGGLDAGQPDAGFDAGVLDPCAGTLVSCGSRCLDIQADPENCGRCGNACGQGQVCNQGRCEVLPDDCTTGTGCGSGYFCDPVSKRCMTGCRLTADCPMGATCAGGTCSCPSGEHACGQQCVSSSAVTSCGTSCAACVVPANAAPVCTGGACDFTCATGFVRQGQDCLDVDECLNGNGGCSANAACANLPGSRTCTCAAGFTGDGITCTDTDECQTNNGGCSASATCSNTPGSRTCACNSGFSGDGLTCTDVDECLTGNGGCGTNATCTNGVGTRTCACNAGYMGNGLSCTDVNECATNNGGCAATGGVCTNTMGSRTCACGTGFTGDGLTCADLDECATNNGGCSTNAACANLPGSRSCTCNTGFSGNGVSCTDVNECLVNNGGCAPTGGACTNLPGSRSCACTAGFTGDGFTCADVNECAVNNGGCAATGGVCTNTPGSRTCACASGFTGTGTTCTDINECAVNNGGCAATGGVCTNTPGNRTCACASGFTGTGTTCTDVNECAVNNGGCAATGGVCTNTPGSRTCACATGFTGNGTICTDLDECATNNGGCSANAACANTSGSRTCTCNAGFAGNGVTCIPSGDTCAAPVVLTASTTVNGSTTTAGNDVGGPLSAVCRGDLLPGRDVVFSFTPATTGTYNVNTVGSGFTPRVYVSSTCGTGSTCSASDPGFASSFNFRGTAGTPVFVNVDALTSTGAGNFTVAVAPVTAPANDTCATATPLALGTPQTGSFVGAVNDVRPVSSCGNGRNTGDVVYSFTPSVTGTYVFRETTGSDVVMWVSAACDGTCTAFVDDPEQLVLTLTAGTPYFFILQPYSSATTFTVSVDFSAPPANDTCATATVLFEGVAASGSTLAATNDEPGPLPAVCGGQSIPGRDVVFSFTPAATGNFNLATTGTNYTPRVYVNSTCGTVASCTAATPVSGSGNFNFRGSAGTPVFVNVDGITASSGGDFSLTVTPIAAPANDTCATATTLAENTPTSGTFVGAVSDVRPVSSCGNGRGNGDVMYAFTPTTTGSYIFRETTASDVIMWVSGACDGTCLGLADEPEQLVVTLTAGTTYFLMLEPYSSASTTFTVSVALGVPPGNDTCTSPAILSTSAAVNGSTISAVNDYAGPLSAICGGDTTPGREVVYSFITPSTGNFRVSATGDGFTPRVYLTSTCGISSSCIASETRSAFNFRSTVGTALYFYVDSTSATSAGDFSLSVAPIAAPANDTCATATPLTLGTPVNGTFVGAVSDVRVQGSCGQGRRTGEVMYSFTPAVSGNYVFRETSTADVVMWVSTVCDGTCLALEDEPEQLTVSLTAGTTYFLLVEPYSTATTHTVSVSTN